MSLSYKKWRNSVYLRPLLGLAFPSSFGGRREQNFKIASGAKNTSLVEQVERACHVFLDLLRSKQQAAAAAARARARSRRSRSAHALILTFAQSNLIATHTTPLDLLPISFCCIG